MRTCVVCGGPLVPVECPLCHGTGEDLDMNDGCGGPCEMCDATGVAWYCEDYGDAAHQDAYYA